MDQRTVVILVVGIMAGLAVVGVVGGAGRGGQTMQRVAAPAHASSAGEFSLRPLRLRPLAQLGRPARSHATGSGTACGATDVCTDTIFKDSYEAPCVPLPDGCGAVEICGNGLDDDCNGLVDDGCACTPGDTQPCFAGTPGQRNVGVCSDGVQVCIGAEFGTWGPCTGGTPPGPELCDGLDNDCNGCVEK